MKSRGKTASQSKGSRTQPNAAQPRKIFGAKTAATRTGQSSAQKAATASQKSAPKTGSTSLRYSQRPAPNYQSRKPEVTPTKNKQEFQGEGRWVIGIHSCMEAIKVRPHAVAEVYFRPDWEHSESFREMENLLQLMEIDILTKPMEAFHTLGHGHQGAAIRVTENPQFDWSLLEEPGKHVVMVLDGIEDPQNLGSMLRTAWLAGVHGILIPEDRAVGLTTTVCKIASGGAEHVAVEALTNFAPEIERLKKLGFWFYGLVEAGKQMPWQLSLPDKVAWVVGSEGSGMRVTTERLCDELVRLPQVKTGSSYNASIAAAMALMETCRQFGKPE